MVLFYEVNITASVVSNKTIIIFIFKILDKIKLNLKPDMVKEKNICPNFYISYESICMDQFCSSFKLHNQANFIPVTV